MERIPEVGLPGGEPQPAVRVTLAVDPALVEALALMADGPYDVAGDDDGGPGTEAAADFLDRLRGRRRRRTPWWRCPTATSTWTR